MTRPREKARSLRGVLSLFEPNRPHRCGSKSSGAPGKAIRSCFHAFVRRGCALAGVAQGTVLALGLKGWIPVKGTYLVAGAIPGPGEAPIGVSLPRVDVSLGLSLPRVDVSVSPLPSPGRTSSGED